MARPNHRDVGGGRGRRHRRRRSRRLLLSIRGSPAALPGAPAAAAAEQLPAGVSGWRVLPMPGASSVPACPRPCVSHLPAPLRGSRACSLRRLLLPPQGGAALYEAGPAFDSWSYRGVLFSIGALTNGSSSSACPQPDGELPAGGQQARPAAAGGTHRACMHARRRRRSPPPNSQPFSLGRGCLASGRHLLAGPAKRWQPAELLSPTWGGAPCCCCCRVAAGGRGPGDLPRLQPVWRLCRVGVPRLVPPAGHRHQCVQI